MEDVKNVLPSKINRVLFIIININYKYLNIEPKTHLAYGCVVGRKAALWKTL